MKQTTIRDWFRPWGWIYRPSHFVGVLFTLIPLAFVFQVFLVIDRRSHSATDTLYTIFPYAGASFLLWLWIAERTSRTFPNTKSYSHSAHENPPRG